MVKAEMVVKRKPTAAQLLMPVHLKELGVAFQAEYRFCPERKFRSDFAIPSRRILIEIDGGAFVFGGHVRGAAFRHDCEKHNLAAAMGFSVFRFLPEQVESGYAKQFLASVLAEEIAPKLKGNAK